MAKCAPIIELAGLVYGERIGDSPMSSSEFEGRGMKKTKCPIVVAFSMLVAMVSLSTSLCATEEPAVQLAPS